MDRKISRRGFLEGAGASCGILKGSSALGALFNLNTLGQLAAQEVPEGNDYRALVCVFLQGGNDSFNMLVPRGQDEYEEYAQIRSSLALPKESLLALTTGLKETKELGIHPALPGVKALYESSNLAFVSNVGTLQQPTTKADYLSNNSFAPQGLFSHSDQQRQWHTALPDRSSDAGWLGKMSTLVRDLNGVDNYASAISVNGLNLAQTSTTQMPYVIGVNGSSGIIDWDQGRWRHARAGVTSQLELDYHNLFQKAFVNRKKEAIELNVEFSQTLQVDQQETVNFGEGSLSDQLEMVLRIIRSRENFGVRRQTFFVMLGGWDHHGDLLASHSSLLAQLDTALSGFQEALNTEGLSDLVTTFTASDFGRSLTANGQGSDHGWGGNQIVMGSAVKGGEVYGGYPDLLLDGPLDVGRGRLIPTTSVDEYFAELAYWFGISKSQLNLILPHINRFVDLTSGDFPLGFMQSNS